jgi:hypothetical protein
VGATVGESVSRVGVVVGLLEGAADGTLEGESEGCDGLSVGDQVSVILVGPSVGVLVVSVGEKVGL